MPNPETSSQLIEQAQNLDHLATMLFPVLLSDHQTWLTSSHELAILIASMSKVAQQAAFSERLFVKLIRDLGHDATHEGVLLDDDQLGQLFRFLRTQAVLVEQAVGKVKFNALVTAFIAAMV